MQTKECKYQGKSLFYRTTGHGPMIVLLHGFGEEGSIWKGQFDLFPNHQLIIPDLPGSGRSEAIDDMSMEGLADAVKAMIAHLTPGPSPHGEGGATAQLSQPPQSPKGEVAHAQGQLKQEASINTASSKSKERSADDPPMGGGAVVIGHSMGGYVALAFAEKYPEFLCGLGLFHSTAYADSEEKKETRRKGIRFIEEHGAAEFLKISTPNLYAPQNREQHPEWIEEHLQAIHNFRGASLVSYYTSMIQRPDRTAVLKKSTVPVLFVIGRHDAAVRMQDSLQQSHMPAIAYIHILAHSGHMGMREEGNKTAQILSQFLNATQKTV